MLPYNDYNSYMRNKYGCKVYRIGLDAGFTCPNRDGTISFEGCAYCGPNGSRASYTDHTKSVREQLENRMTFLRSSKNAKKFVAYFQAFSNTHAPVEKLKKVYDEILPFDDIVGLSIGTRPDTVNDEKMALIASYHGKYEVWIELGLQSANDETLRAINRCHSFNDFSKAVGMAKRLGVFVGAHVIIGLPGETKGDIMRTAEKMNELGIDGVKIHLLHVLRGSRMEMDYNSGNLRLLERDEYIGLLCDFLEILSGDIVIQRLTGEGRGNEHIAPLWATNKMSLLESIKRELGRRGTCQGIKSGCRL